MNALEQKRWFDSEEFEKEFHYDGPLGADYTPNKTVFRLWAPTAEAVTIHLYEQGVGGEAFLNAPMEKGARGVWQYESRQALKSVYYNFSVTVDGVKRESADPYAKACGLNGHRSMVIDLRDTDPEGWAEDRAGAKQPENVIYELHVKDFSWDTAGGFDEADRGKYTALCRTGTTLHHDGVHPTGIDYIKRLGVTHVQLMPIYDFGSVDEAGPADRYNWGYDPVNYNIPEGSYSSDPFNGAVRVRELKQAIQSLHKNGLRVIMDVVYNHTYSLDSWLWRTAPWYFYRRNDDGTPSNGSGCGNDTASERSMCFRYILDSVLYWVEEYHMDGFRFDLMGLMDAELMNRIQEELDKRYGPGEKLVYGEPWSAGGTACRPGTRLGDKGAMHLLDGKIGAFCDDTRDSVKGNLMDVHSRGFVNGGGLDVSRLRRCVTGWADGDDARFQTPYQTITYLSCHDDWTLWDKLVSSMDSDERFFTLSGEVLRANRMAAAINFCCQGHVFFLSGEEFARTKGGVKNSYCSSVEVNLLDWQRAWECAELVDYYRGLISLRKQLPCLCDKSADASKRVLSAAALAENCAGISLDNRDGAHWDTVLLVVNASLEDKELPLPEGKWQLLCDEKSSFHAQEKTLLSDKVRSAYRSVMILGQIK